MSRYTRVLILFAVALAARIFFLAELADDPLFDVFLGDAFRFHAWAREIAAGDLLGSEVFYQAPLYPYFLGAIYALAGWPHALLARSVQAVLGALGCVLLAGAADRLFGRRAAWAAGLLAALYPPAIWLDALIQKTALAGFLTAALLFVLAGHARDPKARRAAGAGLILGLLVLVRENAAVLFPVLGAYVAFGRPRVGVEASEHRRIPAAAAFVAGFALVLAPVAVRNASLGGGFLPTASNAGVNFYLGNSLESDGLYTPLVPGRGHPRYEFADAKRIAERESGHELSPIGVSSHWLRRGRDDVVANPGRWVRLLGRKALLLVNRSEIMDAEAFEAYLDRSEPLATLARFVHFGVLFPLAVIGFVLTWDERRRLWPFWTGALALALGIVLFFVNARFRMGLVPFLVLLAAEGGVRSFDRLRQLRTPAARRLGLGKSVAIAVAAAAAAAFVSNRDPGLPGDPRATTYSNLASAFLRRGEPREAERWAREALRREPDDAQACYNLGEALLADDRPAEAEPWVRRAVELEEAFAADGASLIGRIRAQQGDHAGAVAFFEEALRREPANALFAYNLGLALRHANRLVEAAQAYEEAIRLDPGFPDAHHNLGHLRELEGRWGEAAARYRDALRADPGFERSREALARLLEAHPELRAADG